MKEAWFWSVSFLVVLLVITCSVTVSGQLVCVIIYQQRHSLSVLQTEEARLWSLNRFSENLKKWPIDTHTHTHTHTHTDTHTHTHTHGGDTQTAAGTVNRVEGFFFLFFFTAASSEPSGDLSAAVGQQGRTVTGTGSPGQCRAPPPARPLWRPSWRGRSRWWRVRQPFSRSCSAGEDRGKGQRSSFSFCGISSFCFCVGFKYGVSLCLLHVKRNNWL